MISMYCTFEEQDMYILLQEALASKMDVGAVVERIVHDHCCKNAEEPVQQVAEEPVQQVAEEPVQQVAEEPVQQVAEEPVQQVAEEPVQQTPKSLCDTIYDFLLEQNGSWVSTEEIRAYCKNLPLPARDASKVLRDMELKGLVICSKPHVLGKHRTNSKWAASTVTSDKTMVKCDDILDYLSGKGWVSTADLKRDLGKTLNVKNIASSLNYLDRRGLILCSTKKIDGHKRTYLDKVFWKYEEATA